MCLSLQKSLIRPMGKQNPGLYRPFPDPILLPMVNRIPREGLAVYLLSRAVTLRLPTVCRSNSLGPANSLLSRRFLPHRLGTTAANSNNQL